MEPSADRSWPSPRPVRDQNGIALWLDTGVAQALPAMAAECCQAFTSAYVLGTFLGVDLAWTSATRMSSLNVSPVRRSVPPASTMADEPNETRSAVRPATSARTIITSLSLARAISTALLRATTFALSGGRLLLLRRKTVLGPRSAMSVASSGQFQSLPIMIPHEIGP